MTAFPHLKGNVDLLASQAPTLYKWLSTQPWDEEALKNKLHVNKWGLMDWRLTPDKGLFENLPLGRLYEDWIPKDKADTSATIIIGCNLGYGLNHILTNTPNSHKVLVVEPNPHMLLACLGQTDYTPYFAINKLIFLPPKREILDQTIRQADVQFLFGQIFLRLDMPSQQMGSEYARLHRMCRESLEGFSIEMATLRRKQDVMVGNELKNFQRAVREGSLNGLEGSAKGISAVILGAGPSLEQSAPKLAAEPGRALYATALQTLPALHRLGLKPHFCMAIDYSASMTHVFKRLDKKWAADVPLLYSTKLDPAVLAQYPGPTVPFWTLGGLATFVFSGKEFILDAGGNVSVALFRFLNYCGVSRILLAGQDFAWSGESSHAEGHHAAGRGKRNTVQLKDAEGRPLQSAMPYVSALRDMERDIENSGLDTANLYGGGAVIRGAKAMDFDAARMDGRLASAPGSLEHFLQELGQVHTKRPRPVFEARAQQWASSVRSMHKRLDKLFKKPARNSVEIGKTLERVHLFLRQDPLYLPYLYNEIMDVAGMVYRDKAYAPKDYVAFKAIMKRVLAKVREVDRCLAPDAPVTPADQSDRAAA